MSAIKTIEETTRPYRNGRDWFVGIWQKWRVICAAAFTNLVATNGIETTFGWEHSGITWKAALIQAVVHSIYSGALHIAQGTRPPFTRV